jgi:hypothetical protein
MIMAIKAYNTLDMIAIAYAVDRLNDGYVKFAANKKRANKDIFMEQVLKMDAPKYYDHVTLIEVTDADRAAAQIVEKNLAHMMLKSIKGFENSFEQNIYKIVFSETVGRNDLTLISFVPEFVRRETQQKTTTREIVNSYSGSVHITDPKDAVGIANIFRAIYLSNFEKYMYVAATASGNLVRFYNKEKFEVGDRIKITSCKIKSTEQDKVTKLAVTLLNFVRFKRI